MLASPLLPEIGLAESEDPLSSFKSIIMQIRIQLEETATPSEVSSYTEWLQTILSEQNSILTDIRSMESLAEKNEKKVREIRQKLRDASESLSVENLENGAANWTGLVEHSLDIDGFLYKNVNDFLKSRHLLSTYKCCDCGSSNVKIFEVVSHSASENSLIKLFSFQLPCLKGKKVLDVGSGIGSLLYGAFYFSEASKITGIERNSSACEFLRKVVKKYYMEERVLVVESDFMEKSDLIRQQDVVILNNPFEYFVSTSQEKAMWIFLKDVIKRKTLLVTNPSLDLICNRLELDLSMRSWVKNVEPCIDYIMLHSFDDTDENFCVYEVQ